ETGLTAGSIARERWDIHPDDPLSARGTIHWTETLARGDWQVRTEARCAMWCDATHFHLSAELEAWEGEAMILARNVTRSTPRDHI
ncbi:MAG: peptidase S15, partial [Thermohalobaculum sp.]|nr:peptidase S15 [Thermohalobaculum sp.]